MTRTIKTKNSKALSLNHRPDFFFLFYGFLFMGLVISLVQCSSFGDDPLFDAIDKELQELQIDYEGIKQAGNKIEQLLMENNLESLTSLKFDEANQANLNHQYSADELNTIGSAFGKRKLTSATESFAEYTYSIDGEDYTLTMGVDGEGNWRIIRF